MKHVPIGKSGFVATVDDDDFDRIAAHKWTLSKAGSTFYALTSVCLARGKHVTVYMHRMVMNYSGPLMIDHANRDGLDNRRKNLRTATRGQNSMNRGPKKRGISRFVGVSRQDGENRAKPWFATVARKRIGYFATEEEAAVARDRAALAVYGDFVRSNEEVQ